MSVNITPLLIVFGIGLLSGFLEKILSKGGNESYASILGIATLIVAFGVIVLMIKDLINNLFVYFLPQ